MNLDFILANEIKYIITEKQLKEGDCLPSERELCAIFNVQRLTIRSALQFDIPHQEFYRESFFPDHIPPDSDIWPPEYKTYSHL